MRKHECAYQVTKNYTIHLYNLCKNEKGLYAKFLPKEVIQQLTKNVRGAIKINSENNGTAEELKNLLKRGQYHVVRAPDSVSRLFRLVPMPEGTKMLRVDPMVVDHAENEYRRAHVRRWGVSEI